MRSLCLLLFVLLASHAIADQNDSSPQPPGSGGSSNMMMMMTRQLLTVTGDGEASVPASLVIIRFSTQGRGLTPQAALDAMTNITNSVVVILQGGNASLIQTTSLFESAQYSYVNGKQNLTGYLATEQLSASLSISNNNTTNVGILISQCVAANATIVGMSFVASPDDVNQAQLSAIRAAVTSANARASTVLSQLNLTQKSIASLDVTVNSLGNSPTQLASLANPSSSSPTVILPQVIPVFAKVIAVFEFS